jgi:hypothetical protein
MLIYGSGVGVGEATEATGLETTSAIAGACPTGVSVSAVLEAGRLQAVRASARKNPRRDRLVFMAMLIPLK